MLSKEETKHINSMGESFKAGTDGMTQLLAKCRNAEEKVCNAKAIIEKDEETEEGNHGCK